MNVLTKIEIQGWVFVCVRVCVFVYPEHGHMLNIQPADEFFYMLSD